MSFIRVAANVLRLRAGGEELVVDLELGDRQIRGFVGQSKPGVGFSQYVSLDEPPSVLAFARKHDVVDIVYESEGVSWGGSNRTMVAHGCTLADAFLYEPSGGMAIRYEFAARSLSGFGFLMGGGE